MNNTNWQLNVSKMFMNLFGAFIAGFSVAFGNGLNMHNSVRAGCVAAIAAVAGFLQRREKL